MYKHITLIISLVASTASGIEVSDLIPQDMDKTIYTLNYIREENKEAAEKLEKLYLETTDAMERSSISKLIDVLLQACIYLTERIKFYEANFQKTALEYTGEIEFEEESEVQEDE